MHKWYLIFKEWNDTSEDENTVGEKLMLTEYRGCACLQAESLCNEADHFHSVLQVSHLEELRQNVVILLMEKILHQLIDSLSHYLQGCIHLRWRRISSINSIARVLKISCDIARIVY